MFYTPLPRKLKCINMFGPYTALSVKNNDGLITVTVYRFDGEVEYMGDWYDRDEMVAFLKEEFNIKYD